MNDFLNFSLNSLNLLDNQIHDNIKGTFVDDFIHELQSYLELQTSNTILENLPKNAKDGDTLVFKNGNFVIKK